MLGLLAPISLRTANCLSVGWESLSARGQSTQIFGHPVLRSRRLSRGVDKTPRGYSSSLPEPRLVDVRRSASPMESALQYRADKKRAGHPAGRLGRHGAVIARLDSCVEKGTNALKINLDWELASLSQMPPISLVSGMPLAGCLVCLRAQSHLRRLSP